MDAYSLADIQGHRAVLVSLEGQTRQWAHTSERQGWLAVGNATQLLAQANALRCALHTLDAEIARRPSADSCPGGDMMDTYTANDLYAARGHFAHRLEQLEATQAMARRISAAPPDAPRSTEEYMTRVALAAIDAEIARRLLTELAEIVT
jgi:hypothetical protein